jgi:type III pantothenate kinase
MAGVVWERGLYLVETAMKETQYIVCVDIGNTHTTVGLAKGSGLIACWDMATEATSTRDELAVKLNGLLGLKGMGLADIGAVVISSVVPAALDCWRGMSRRHMDLEAVDLHTRAMEAVAISYPRPHEVGTDRLVNAVAAWNRLKGPAIVVDLGTATTFDCISAKGEYLGGAIAPGMLSAMRCLSTSTARLPAVSLPDEPVAALGQSTVSAIHSGILHGFGAMVDGMAKRLRAEFDPSATVLATGGLAKVLSPYCNSVELVVEHLAMEGMLHLYRNGSAS